ncbi:MAG: GTP pyrophosphokinase family protein [Clostridia bacterium]|nr:GTP pyrophosphokinase family protein [Clostridia bacterium]
MYEINDSVWDSTEEDALSAPLNTLSKEFKSILYRQTKTIMGKMIDYKELRMIYACAMKEIKTKFEILNTEFSLSHHRNPISSVQTRLKSTSSIIEKLIKLNKSVSIDSIEENIHDIAGVRVICSYIDDVYLVANALLKQDDISLVAKKDYIENPKENGYRSLHLIVKVPVFLSEQRLDMEVEVQIRTIAMDFWASLEHQLQYKKEFDGKNILVDELHGCAEKISKIDNDMMQIRFKMEALADIPTDDEILLERIRKIDTPIE